MALEALDMGGDCRVLASYASMGTEWCVAPLWLWVSISQSVLGRFVGTNACCKHPYVLQIGYLI